MKPATNGNPAYSGAVIIAEILDTAQAAAYLQMSKPTLERWRLTGEGPPYLKINAKMVRYRRADLDAWLQGHLVRSTSEVAA